MEVCCSLSHISIAKSLARTVYPRAFNNCYLGGQRGRGRIRCTAHYQSGWASYRHRNRDNMHTQPHGFTARLVDPNEDHWSRNIVA